MNNIFFFVFGVLLVVTGVLDIPKVRKLKKSMRMLHLLLYGGTFVLFVCLYLDIDVPMPTRYFIQTISPWVFSMIHPS